MRFLTKLWRRSDRSFATTIPLPLLFKLNLDDKHTVEWSYDSKSSQWSVDFIENKKVKKGIGTKIYTLLWKRSQKSYGTTLPHPVIMYLDEIKNHEVEWEYDPKISKWTIKLKEVARK